MDGVMREPLKVRLNEEAQAHAVVRELAGIDGVAVEPGSGAWEVTVGDGNGDRLVVAVLDAVRRALAGQPTESALVFLDGREYQLQGE
jgi:outer membrane lipoprotein SlyB